MRLYLSSYGLGDYPEKVLDLVKPGGRTAVIMNAQDLKTPESRKERLDAEKDALRSLGLKPEELDLRKYFGKKEELISELRKYDFVWVRGGNVFLLRRAFKQSGFDNAIKSLLRHDKIAYGGFSAGACILAPSLRGIEFLDPKDDIAAGYDKDVVWEGLGVIDYAIAPHYKSGYPESKDVDKCVEYFENNGIAYKTLRDGEAIVINGDSEKLLELE